VKTDKILEILSGNSGDGTAPLSIEDRIASLPPDLLVRTFDTHARIAEESAQKKTLNDVVCRLLASGMPANEIVMILCVKAQIVDEAAKYQKELIAQYAKQLKGRRQRAKNKQRNEN
jgi:hypothetical protein